MDKDFKFSQLENPDDKERHYQLSLIEANVSEYFRYWSNLGDREFGVLEVRQDQDGLYSVIINNRDMTKFPSLAVAGEPKKDPIEAALSSVDKLESLVDKDCKYDDDIQMPQNKISRSAVNNYIKKKVADGSYDSYSDMECVGFTKGFSVDNLSRVSSEAYAAIFRQKEFGIIEFGTIPGDYLQSRTGLNKKYGEEEAIEDFCHQSLHNLHEKKLARLSEEASDKLHHKFNDTLNELNVTTTVRAQGRYGDKEHPIGYQICMDHKIFPIRSMSKANFPDLDWSYYSARDEMSKQIGEHKAKLAQIVNSDEKLKYLVGGITDDLCAEAAISDLSDKNGYKSVKVCISSFPTNFRIVEASNSSWDLVFQDVQQKYREIFDFLNKHKQEQPEHEEYINVKGLPTAMIFDLQEAKNPGDINKILYGHLKKALELNDKHTKIPPYFDQEKLKIFVEMALQEEEYEVASKIKKYISASI